MEKAVEMYIHGKSSGSNVAAKMNVPLQTLYLSVIKNLMQKKVSIYINFAVMYYCRQIN